MNYKINFSLLKCSPGMAVVFQRLGKKFGYCSGKPDKAFTLDIDCICKKYKVGRSVAYMYYKILRGNKKVLTGIRNECGLD